MIQYKISFAMSDLVRRIAELLETLPAAEYYQDEIALARELQAVVAEVIPRKRMASLMAGVDAKFVELKASHGDTMAYLGWAEVVALRYDHFQGSDLAKIDALVTELIHQASSHAEIRARQAVTRTEERARFERLVAVEVQIDSVVDRLCALCRGFHIAPTAPTDQSPTLRTTIQDVDGAIGQEHLKSAALLSGEHQNEPFVPEAENVFQDSQTVAEEPPPPPPAATSESVAADGHSDSAGLLENEEEPADCLAPLLQLGASQGGLGEVSDPQPCEQPRIGMTSVSDDSECKQDIARQPLSNGADGPVPQRSPEGSCADRTGGDTLPVDAGTSPSSINEGFSQDAPPVAAAEPSSVDRGTPTAAELAEAFDSALDTDDLPLAAWIARCSCSLGYDCVPPDWLIEAVIAGRSLDAEGDAAALALAERASENLPELAKLRDLILGVAASLRAALLCSYPTVRDWLSLALGRKELTSVASVADAVLAFGSAAGSLSLAQLDTARSHEAHRELWDRKRKSFEQWKQRLHREFIDRNSMPHQNSKIETMQAVFQLWTTPDQPLGKMIAAAERGMPKDHAVLRDLAREWKKPKVFLEDFRRKSSDIAGRSVASLQSTPRSNVEDIISAGIKVMLDLIPPEKTDGPESEPWSKESFNLMASLRERLPDAISETKRLGTQPGIRAVAVCLERTLVEFGVLTGVCDDHEPPKGSDVHGWYSSQLRSPESALMRSLLWMPEVHRDQSGNPDLGGLAEAVVRRAKQPRAAVECIREWCALGDFGRAQQLLEAVPESQRGAEASRLDQELTAARARILRETEELEATVEVALVDGIIRDEDRSLIRELIAAPTAGSVLDVSHRSQELQAIRDDLSAKREATLDHLVVRWSGIKERLSSNPVDAGVTVRRDFSERLEEVLRRGDVRIVEEWLSVAEEGLDEGSEMEARLNALVSGQGAECIDALAQFISVMPVLQKYALETGIANLVQSLEMGIDHPEVPLESPTERDQAIKLLDAWTSLKKANHRDTGAKVGWCQVILQFLGLAIPPDHSGPLHRVINDRGHVFFAAARTAGHVSPIANFGSRTRGSYNVLCIWGKFDPDGLKQTLQLDAWDNNTHLVLIYPEVMSSGNRAELASLCRACRYPIAALDEILLLFLIGRKPGERLSAFLHCALAWSFVNPYARDAHALVDPEMFTGRKGAIEMVGDFRKSCIVFGGRQLGKTAVLRQVRDRYNRGDVRVIYMSLEFLRSDFTAGRTSSIWNALDQEFQKVGILKEHTEPLPAHRAQKRILEALEKKPMLQLLVLLDEADDFLDSDTENDFRTVAELKDLMTNSARRIKFVLAGNYQTQRYAGGNHPLTIYGRPIVIKQMGFSASRTLVERPLRALGFRFADDAVVTRILSHTLYYAGLIQLFLHELVEQWRRNHERDEIQPPYIITSEMVDQIAADASIRETLLDRFLMTMDLDPEYGAIVYGMILASPESECPYYTAAEIMEIARMTWPRGFRDTEPTQLNVRLLEMCGLGLLVRHGTDDQYRLRSQNLVRLFGSRHDVQRRLSEMQGRTPVPKLGSERRRDRILTNPARYSPLTRAQDRLIRPSSIGPRLLFGTAALRLDLVEQALRSQLPDGGMSTTTLAFLGSALEESPTRIADRIVDALRKGEREQSLLVACDSISRAADPLIQVTDMVASRIHLGHRFVRVLIIGDALTAWRWLTLPRSKRAALEDRSGAAMFISGWDEYGIMQRIHDAQLAGDHSLPDRILELTGGWPVLVDALFDRLKTHDVSDELEAFAADLASGALEVSDSFVAGTGWDVDPLVTTVVTWLKANSPVPADLWTPEFVADGTIAVDDWCQVALEYLTGIGLAKRIGSDVIIDPVFARMHHPVTTASAVAKAESGS